VAAAAPWWGILLAVASIATPAVAADVPPVHSWAESIAEREQLSKLLPELVAAGKTDEAVGTAEKLVAADRRILTLPAASDAEKETRQDVRREAIEKLQWIVEQRNRREEWSAAAGRQRELAEILATDLGNSHYRVIDARNEQSYLEGLASLKGDVAREVAKANGCLAKVAELYRQGKYREAISLADQSVKALRPWLGESSPQLAAGLNWQGRLHATQGDYARAEPLLRQALEIRRKVLGENHPDYAESLNNLALLYDGKGDYPRAETFYGEALVIRKKSLGENHPDYAGSLNDLAALYNRQGNYARAEPLLRQAAEIRKRALGEDHPEYARSLNNLAFLYYCRGDYARAEPLYRQVLEIRKKALGESHPDYASSLSNLALLYWSQGDYRRAELPLRQAVEIQKKVLGESHPGYALSLGNLAWLYKCQGDYARAEPLLRQALLIRKKALGENHPDYAAGLNGLATVYEAQGEYARAEPLRHQALEINKKVLGESHPNYAISLHNLAVLYKCQGDYARAEPLYRQALEIWKKVLGEHHPSYATALVNLAWLYVAQGDYARAEPLYQQALQIRKKALGENHPDYANSLIHLATLYDDQGDYARAELLYRQALEIRKKVLGENHPEYAEGLNNLASMFAEKGDYTRAEPLLRQALDIRKRAGQENHPDYAVNLNNLAGLYDSQGDYARAEPLYRQALEITRKALGANHPDYARGLHDLAVLYNRQNDYVRAEPLYRQAQEIWKKALGENNPHYATSLSSLAALYNEHGDYAQAEPLLRRALEITKKVFGENHPNYANVLNNLAFTYDSQGAFTQAELFYRQALEIRKKILGENHPDYALSLHNLAGLYKAQGDYARAEPLGRQAVTIQFNQLETTAAIQSERQQLAMLQVVRFYLDQYLASTASNDQFSTSAYRLMLAWKGIVFRRERLARAGEQTPELAALFRQLQQVAGQLAKLAWATPDPQQAARWRESSARLSEKKEQLEAELSSRSAAFRRAKAASTLEDVQAALPKDVVLVDFLESSREDLVALPQRGGLGVRFDQAGGETKITKVVAAGAAAQDGRLQADDLILALTDGAGKWTATAGKSLQGVADLMGGSVGTKVTLRIRRAQEQEPREITLTRAPLPWQRKFDRKWELENVAFVVRHDGPVVRLNLGPAKPISDAIDAWRQTCGASPQSVAAGRLLREKLWQPIAARIHDAKIVLVSPDGALNKLPLGALPGKDPGKYLIEEYPLAIIPTAQIIPEIVRGETHQPLSGNLLLVGNIDYDGHPAQAPSSPQEIGRETPRGFVHFNRLPATQREVALIENLYHQDFGATGIRTLEEGRATKAAFLAQAGRYRYLHLATHGFFIQERLPTAVTQSQRGADHLGGMPGGLQAAELHAGLLSGLALAGANQAGRAGNIAAVAEDPGENGILTAEEIGAQNLDGVQLVMLSACETGLGKAAGGEGLLGLQRSFQAAGARAVVASLWKVPDEETKALMGAFYTNLWQKRLSPIESLRRAQLTMLRSYDARAGQLRAPDFSHTAALPTGGVAETPAAVRRSGLPPAYWAAFVLSGDWR
jgi:tetratricopeptide (TPR) repeat protein/CHAT domain-containing protein